MKFKDRLNLYKESIISENNNQIEFKQDVDVLDIFLPNSDVNIIIEDAICNNKNIIVASSIDCDNTICAQYIKMFIKDTDNVELLYDINKDIQFIKANRIIVPDIDILGFVKILEFILYGYKSFIYTIDIKTYENILESIKTLIMLYYKNLTDCAVENLLGLSNSIIVYINKNADGLFYVSNIGTIEYKDKNLSLVCLYPKSVNNNTEEECSNFTEVISDLSNNIKNETLYNDELNDLKEPVEIENKELDNTKEVKINKYKLLKEKLKSKKRSI